MSDYYDGRQCQDVIELLTAHWVASMGPEAAWNLGCVAKYLWRAGRKGDPYRDLAKASQYLHYQLELMREGRMREGRSSS